MYQSFAFPDDDSPQWNQLHELHMAAMMGNLDEVARLLDAAEACSVNAVDACGCAAIHWAALSSSVELMLLLVERGANVRATTATSATALHIAAYNGRVAICKLLLLHGADVHAEDSEGRVALYDARFMTGGACPCAADSPETQNGRVAAFLERAMQLSTAERASFVQRSWGLFVSETLQDALGSPRRLAKALPRYKAHVDARDYDGSTALHAAAQQGHVEGAQMLLAHGAHVACRTNLEETPLHLAAREGHAALVTLLIAHGASVGAQSRAGRTPADEARWATSAGESAAVVAALASRNGAQIEVVEVPDELHTPLTCEARGGAKRSLRPEAVERDGINEPDSKRAAGSSTQAVGEEGAGAAVAAAEVGSISGMLDLEDPEPCPEPGRCAVPRTKE